MGEMTKAIFNADAMRELLARIEAATGPDRELDLALGIQLAGWRYAEVPGCGVMLEADGDFYNDDPGGMFPALTESIDLALALVDRCLPGWEWSYHPDAGIKLWRSFFLGGYDEARGDAETIPLAILAALLRAVLEQKP